MYKTGSFCPISGSYSFVKHTDDSGCMLKHKEIIHMEYTKTFPNSKECGNPVFWVYLRDELVDQMK